MPIHLLYLVKANAQKINVMHHTQETIIRSITLSKSVAFPCQEDARFLLHGKWSALNESEREFEKGNKATIDDGIFWQTISSSISWSKGNIFQFKTFAVTRCMVRLQFHRHFLLISREKKGLHFMRLLPSPQHLSLLKG